MLLCGADMLESFIKPGVWFPEHVEEILGKHGVVCIARWVSCSMQLQLVVSSHRNIHCLVPWSVHSEGAKEAGMT